MKENSPLNVTQITVVFTSEMDTILFNFSLYFRNL